MASHFFSRARYLHSLRSALSHSHPNPFRTPLIACPLAAREASSFSRLRRHAPAFPYPRLFSHSSSASIANEDAVHFEAENGKTESSEATPEGGNTGLAELFKSRSAAGSVPENGKLRWSVSEPWGQKKPTDQLRSNIMGSSRTSGESKESEMEGEEGLREGIDEMKKNLRALEQTPKKSKNKPVDNPGSLTSLFVVSDRKARRRRSSSSVTTNVKSKAKSAGSSNPVANDLFSSEDVSANDFSPELISFVERLIEEGNMQKANFLKDGKLKVNSLCSSYARNFVRSIAEQFAREHQEVAKWLSGSELKKVASVGCPQIDRKTAFSAKRLRSFFEIQENNVCEACQLKELCSFKNIGVQTEENLNLVNVLRVLTIYALNSAHPKLVVSQETKESVSKLVKEVVDLSK
ncbi:hypothetical protein EJ110_NYTH52624 [Nymphaea thermarum]|nr:hypothetical protein EJ110_NYTH52624 [Nymphaea thermarum]